MHELGSCVAPISGEHLISESVIHILQGDGEFSVSGLPWQEDGEVRILSASNFKTNCLCTKHNSTLHLLDDAAKFFFDAIMSALQREKGTSHALLSGHDIERWFLKTAKAFAVSRNFARSREKLRGDFSDNLVVLDMLDNPKSWPPGAGLYCVMMEGALTENHRRFQMQPLTNARDEILALALNVLGLRFVLILDHPDLIPPSFLQGANFRPGRIQVSYPGATHWVTLSWEDNIQHLPLTLQYRQDVLRAQTVSGEIA